MGHVIVKSSRLAVCHVYCTVPGGAPLSLSLHSPSSSAASSAARSAAASSTLISSNAIPASPSALFARLQCGHDDVPTTVTDVAPSVVAARARDAARVDA